MKIPLDHIENGLKLEISGDSDNSTFEVSDELASENAESKYRIKEGCSYQYKLNSEDYRLVEKLPVITISKFHPNEGRIYPNIYVGTLALEILKPPASEPCGVEYIEVLATKLGDSFDTDVDEDYLTNYKSMLEDIASRCSDLLMQINSPIFQKFEPDFENESRTLYQRFAFVRSLILSDDFNDAVNRILFVPSSKWKDTQELDDIRRVHRITPAISRQIITAGNRVDFKLTDNISSIPSKVMNLHRIETYDTPENRFIKYALQTFVKFFENCESRFKDLKYQKSALEAEVSRKKLQSYLEAPFFKEISRPATLQLNSPLLQRKSGYREILNAWILFDTAAKLIWKGGENIYKADKRDIAVLYEYWLFFQLYDLFSNKFDFTEVFYDNHKVNHLIARELVEETKDGLGLKLKSGKETSLIGKARSAKRDLNVRFSYNRTFSGETVYEGNEGIYKAGQGSWTKSLRPDYSLSLWPSQIDENEAENEDIIVHVHFDAKYKLKWLDILKKDTGEKETSDSSEEEYGEGELGDKTDSLECEKRDERKGIYKNADLLKMHAYKDAIRRTGGSYVLYPGNTEPKTFFGFHEVMPGLGAFAIRPSKDRNNGISELSDFIDRVIDHFQDRTSQRERLFSKIYEIHKTRKTDGLNETVPEYLDIKSKIKLIPDDTNVLVGYCKSKKHWEWIIQHSLYNGRVGTGKGALNLTPEIIGAHYLLLHSKDEQHSGKLFKIVQKDDEKPKIISADDEIFKDYPNARHPFYLIFHLQEPDDEFRSKEWSFKELKGYSENKDALPFSCTLTELMKFVVRNDSYMETGL
jgi:predicted component of viral defense system (DUF524 family)